MNWLKHWWQSKMNEEKSNICYEWLFCSTANIHGMHPFSTKFWNITVYSCQQRYLLMWNLNKHFNICIVESLFDIYNYVTYTAIFIIVSVWWTNLYIMRWFHSRYWVRSRYRPRCISTWRPYLWYPAWEPVRASSPNSWESRVLLRRCFERKSKIRYASFCFVFPLILAYISS